jgi:hypothetical protein
MILKINIYELESLRIKMKGWVENLTPFGIFLIKLFWHFH